MAKCKDGSNIMIVKTVDKVEVISPKYTVYGGIYFLAGFVV